MVFRRSLWALIGIASCLVACRTDAPYSAPPEDAGADDGIVDAAEPEGMQDSGPPGPEDVGDDGAVEAEDVDAAEDEVLEPAVLRVALNEVSCQGDEWIEIINLGEGVAELSGWSVTDEGAEPRPFALDGVVLGPGEVALIAQQTRRQDGFTFAIGCGDDAVRLIDAQGAAVDGVEVPVRPPAFAWGRLPDGVGAWGEVTPTPGGLNRPPEAPGGSLFDPQSVVTIDLTIAPEMLARLGEEPREYVPASFQLTDAEGQGEQVVIEVRLKGRAGSFRPLEEKSAFKVKFNLEDGQRFRGLKLMTLNNMVQDHSRIHEWLAYTLFRGVGVPVPRVGYALVRVNGEEYGLYSNIEAMDDVFLDRHFDSTGHLYEGAYGQDLFADHIDHLEVDEGDAGDRGDLEALVELLDRPPSEGFYEATQALIDWPEVLKVMAVEVYIGHWDGYAPSRNNFFLHTDQSGVLSLLPWGTDQTFRDHLSLNLESSDRRGRLFGACMADRGCIQAYNATLMRVFEFVEGMDAEAQVRAQQEVLRPWVALGTRGGPGEEEVAHEVDRTLEFLVRRQEDLTIYAECLLGPNPDPDGDGFACTADCDNSDSAIYPGAQDICQDEVDQDCNGRVDDGAGCPECHERLLGPHRYLVCTQHRDRDAAREVCRLEGAELVVLGSPGEARWMGEVAASIWPQSYWVGLDDSEEEGSFVWLDGSALTYEDFWNGGEPNDYGDGEDCVQLLDNGRWNDIPCSAGSAVLCEAVCEEGLDEDGDGALRCGDDCDDGDPAVHPGAREICRDGVDQDCNGVVDDGGCVSCQEVEGQEGLYSFCRTRLAWAEARAECQDQGGDLVILNDAQEGGWVNVNARQRIPGSYWIGLTDPDRDNVFEWVDGGALEYTRWHEGEPNNPDEACGQVYPDTALWNDLGCDAALPFVCERPR